MATTKPTTNNTTRSSKLPVRRTSASTASIISSMTTVMPITTNRNSLPALAETTRRATHVTRNVQCTHLTTTRLFTREFRCGICFREGSFGWVWRCTQDRELMLEDDMDHGHASQEKLDDLCDIFPRRTAPRPRGPEARKSRLSFLDEISNKDLKTYTPAQIQTILRQRSHLLDVLTDSEEPELTPSNSSTNIPRFLFNPFSRPSLSTAQTVPNMRVTNPRPWLPSRGTECQFKCCHTCRPTLLDRSFLSLNAILDDDLPCTAITGFGFNLQKFRPVAKVEVVKNLGLRPNPVPVEVNPSRSRSRNLRYQKRAANLSLGILTHRSNATPIPNNPNYNSSPSPTDTCNPSHPARNSFPRSDIFSNSPSSTPGSFPTSSSETTSTSSESSAYPFPYIAMSGPTYQSNNITNPFTSNSNIPQNHAVLIPLPPQTPSEVSLLATPTTPTLMEESESDGHFFGAEPLEVEDGVAVMEEGVGLHVPDVLITQY
ncbi:hypothetical protein SS1G_03367 [Sclerotinia sclerotiorum 1980 UF-70]|uniref:Uncharacterized protein n=2 Tax=Sclerotinia sclerotiorum (strain ATCC 18683 / 1980 / Ss-1) TaxID=665079 RepID=A7EDH7_SCLS1|nr:hypothetical protein SS1G_03367 [Sclerotinia sclerotiorum 1980 UF-70]APA10942.1 hypothetical protein sscle_07g057120 [Sclerotinia sclerotiorum 1980 UF-70]EDO00893.1 hypothetical protein SS1G_03367 [Sclerotinia sclerotiorum 1980 UF-70]